MSLGCCGSKGGGSPCPTQHREELHLIQEDAEARTMAGSPRPQALLAPCPHDKPSPCPSNTPRDSGAELTSFPPSFPCAESVLRNSCTPELLGALWHKISSPSDDLEDKHQHYLLHQATLISSGRGLNTELSLHYRLLAGSPAVIHSHCRKNESLPKSLHCWLC